MLFFFSSIWKTWHRNRMSRKYMYLINLFSPFVCLCAHLFYHTSIVFLCLRNVFSLFIFFLFLQLILQTYIYATIVASSPKHWCSIVYYTLTEPKYPYQWHKYKVHTMFLCMNRLTRNTHVSSKTIHVDGDIFIVMWISVDVLMAVKFAYSKMT